MSSRIAVIDYGIGNVFSVCNALSHIGADPELTRDVSRIMQADRVILPGVGAFGRAMDALREFGLDAVLQDYVQTGKPLLGICIGMQVLMDRSSEFGDHAGLGLIPGDVDLIPQVSPQGENLRVPHIAWQPLHPSGSGWSASALEGIDAKASFYFVHSFHARPTNAEHVIATADYEGVSVTAAVRHDNVTGVQFHPERSGPAGLDLLARFAK
jgi:glutamine amidotransferase